MKNIAREIGGELIIFFPDDDANRIYHDFAIPSALVARVVLDKDILPCLLFLLR